MFPRFAPPIRRALAALSVAALLPLGAAWGAPISWTISITPKGGGQVDWATSSPAANGTLDASGKIVVEQGGFLDLTFRANDGYVLVSVFKNADDWTFFLDGNDHFQFGPVANAHKITATYGVVVPTGAFDFPFPTGHPALTAIASLTGNYTGTMPGPFFARHYDLDVAMDEAGKVVVLGSVDGVVPEPGAGPVGGAGAVKTVDGKPTMQLKMGFEGTLDGVAATAKASGGAALDVVAVGGGTVGLEGTHSYKTKLGGVPFSEKNAPVHASFDPASVGNVAKDWTLGVDIDERTDAKGKRYIVARADLVLPDGDTIVFAERKAKYTVAKGYSLAFKNGMNVTLVPPAVAKKVKIQIKRMTLVKDGLVWRPTGGTIHYQFFGQKGVADLLEFLAPG
jgi:hypothetical protein